MSDYSNQNISAKQAGYKDTPTSSSDPILDQIKAQEEAVTQALAAYQEDIDDAKKESQALSSEAKQLYDQLKDDKDGKIASKVLGLFLLKINDFKTSDQLAPTFGHLDVTNKLLGLQNLMTKQFNQSLNLTNLGGYVFAPGKQAVSPPTFDATGGLKLTDGSTMSAQDVSEYSLTHGVYFKLSNLNLVFEGNPISGPDGTPKFGPVSKPGDGATQFATTYISVAHAGYFTSICDSSNEVAKFLESQQQSSNQFWKDNPDLIESMASFASSAIKASDPLSAQEAQNMVFTGGGQDAISDCQAYKSEAASNMSEATGSINSIDQRAATETQTEENMAKGFLDASKNIVQQSLQMLQKMTDNMPK